MRPMAVSFFPNSLTIPTVIISFKALVVVGRLTPILLGKNARSTIEMNDPASRPEIAIKRDNMKDYDTIFVGFPIWWYVAPTIINTFLESYDLSGKTIIPFATSGGSGIGKTNERLAPSCKGAKLMDGKVFKGSVGHQELAAWVEGLGL